jgi:hypothetical protein
VRVCVYSIQVVVTGVNGRQRVENVKRNNDCSAASVGQWRRGYPDSALDPHQSSTNHTPHLNYLVHILPLGRNNWQMPTRRRRSIHIINMNVRGLRWIFISSRIKTDNDEVMLCLENKTINFNNNKRIILVLLSSTHSFDTTLLNVLCLRTFVPLHAAKNDNISFDNYVTSATWLRILGLWSQGGLQLVGHWAGKYEINNTTL